MRHKNNPLYRTARWPHESTTTPKCHKIYLEPLQSRKVGSKIDRGNVLCKGDIRVESNKVPPMQLVVVCRWSHTSGLLSRMEIGFWLSSDRISFDCLVCRDESMRDRRFHRLKRDCPGTAETGLLFIVTAFFANSEVQRLGLGLKTPHSQSEVEVLYLVVMDRLTNNYPNQFTLVG